MIEVLTSFLRHIWYWICTNLGTFILVGWFFLNTTLVFSAILYLVVYFFGILFPRAFSLLLGVYYARAFCLLLRAFSLILLMGILFVLLFVLLCVCTLLFLLFFDVD